MARARAAARPLQDEERPSAQAQTQMQTLPIQEKILDLKIREMDAQSRRKPAERWNGSAANVLPALPNWVVVPAG